MNPPQAPVSPLRKLPPLNSEHSGARLQRPKGPDHAISLPTMASHLSTADAVHRSMISPASTLPVTRETSSETNMTPTSPVRKTSISQPFMRPIKFVSNDGLPHSKRRRIKSACVSLSGFWMTFYLQPPLDVGHVRKGRPNAAEKNRSAKHAYKTVINALGIIRSLHRRISRRDESPASCKPWGKGRPR